jgi:hypothetical protein
VRITACFIRSELFATRSREGGVGEFVRESQEGSMAEDVFVGNAAEEYRKRSQAGTLFRVALQWPSGSRSDH